MKLYTFDWIMIAVWTPVVITLIVLVVKRIKRDRQIYANHKKKFHRWLHQFDDPTTGD